MSSSRVQVTFTGAPSIAWLQEPGLDHEVGLRLAAEAAAEERHVDGDVLLLQPEALREPRARRLRRLHAGPGLALAVLDAHQRRRRLHRRLREVRDVVLRLDALCGLCHRAIHVALLAHDLARPARRALELGAVGVGRIGGVRAVVPDDLELVAALHRRPGVAWRRRRRRRAAGTPTGSAARRSGPP